MKPLLVTTWEPWSDALMDADSPQRRLYERLELDRLIAVQFEPVDLGLITSVV